MRKISTKEILTEMKLYSNDKCLFIGKINEEIKIYFYEYKNNSFILIGTFI